MRARILVSALTACAVSLATGGSCLSDAPGEQPGPPNLTLVPQLGHRDQVSSVAYAPDGQTIVTGGSDGLVIIWDAASGEQLRTLMPESRPGSFRFSPTVEAVAFSPDGKLLAAGGYTGGVTLWDTDTFEQALRVEIGKAASMSLEFSPNGDLLAMGARSSIKLIDLATGQAVQELTGSPGWVYALAFSADGTCLASASEENCVRLWDVRTGKLMRTVPVGPEGECYVFSIALSPTGTQLVAGSNRPQVSLCDLTSGLPLRMLEGHHQRSWVHAVAFSPDGRTFASGGSAIIVWDAATGQAVHTLRGHSNIVESVAFSADGTRLASASRDHGVALWDVESGEQIWRHPGHGPAHWLAVSPDGSLIAADSPSRHAVLWDAQTGQQLRTIGWGEGGTGPLAFSLDSRVLATGGLWGGPHRGSVRFWDATTGGYLADVKAHHPRITDICYGLDTKLIATASEDNTVALWDAESLELLRRLDGPTEEERHEGAVAGLHEPPGSERRIDAVALSPDGKLIAAGTWANTALVWDADTGELLHTLSGHWYDVLATVFSPDGKLLATGAGYSRGRTEPTNPVFVWHASTGELAARLDGPTASVPSVAFSPDGRLVAAASHEGLVFLWETATGDPVGRLAEPEGFGFEAVAFMPDGRRLVSADRAGLVRVWDVTTGALLLSLWNIVERDEMGDAVSADQWLAWTPEGYYDCSEGGESWLRFRDAAGGLHPASEHARTYRNPEKIRAALSR